MTRFLTASQDLEERTLAALIGEINRALYLGSLAIDGQIYHPGLEREYGEQVAKDVLAKRFVVGCTKVMSTPLSQSWNELEFSASTSESLTELKSVWEKNKSPGSRSRDRHFSFVIDALSICLREARANRAS